MDGHFLPEHEADFALCGRSGHLGVNLKHAGLQGDAGQVGLRLL
jgi:hypothetical protein